jgi:hypothetical protein
MKTIYKKVLIKNELPPLNKFVPTIDEDGEIIMYRLTEQGWNMRDCVGKNSPNNNKAIIYWLKEISIPNVKIHLYITLLLLIVCSILCIVNIDEIIKNGFSDYIVLLITGAGLFISYAMYKIVKQLCA